MVCPGRVRYNKNAAAFPLRGGGPRHLQIITAYVTATGEARVRVTTASVTTVADAKASTFFTTPGMQRTIGGPLFDQAAAIVLVARLACQLFEQTPLAGQAGGLYAAPVRLLPPGRPVVPAAP